MMVAARNQTAFRAAGLGQRGRPRGLVNRFGGVLVLGVVLLAVAPPAAWPNVAAGPRAGRPDVAAGPRAGRGSITDTSIQLPSWDAVARVVTLRDYNTRVVVLAATLLGVAAGTIGTFVLLRKRALLGDALSHATLPGIGIAFVVMVALGAAGKSLAGLLLGALLSGIVGVASILAIIHLTRIKEDAALGIVLSVFFGLGVAVLGVIQKMGTGSAAGLEYFIYGKTASMVAGDAQLIGAVALLVVLVCILFFKEFSLLCFDAGYAGSQGWPVVLLDMLMMSLVAMVTVIGLQAVGLILIIALLVTPPAAARFWTEHLPTMALTSAGIGAASGLVGAILSALQPRLPAGAIIVVVAGAIFVVSMLFGASRGVLLRLWNQRALARKVARQHLLRAMFEWIEAPPPGSEQLSGHDGTGDGGPVGAPWLQPGGTPADGPTVRVPFAELLAKRAWTVGGLRRTLAAAQRAGLVKCQDHQTCALTAAGLSAARRVVRNHRLWELFLLTHAEVATSQVDRDADRVEHVLGPEMIAELEVLLVASHPHLAMPASPHGSNDESRSSGRGG